MCQGLGGAGRLLWKAAAEKASPGPFSTMMRMSACSSFGWNEEIAIFSSRVVPAWPCQADGLGGSGICLVGLGFMEKQVRGRLRFCTSLSGGRTRPKAGTPFVQYRQGGHLCLFCSHASHLERPPRSVQRAQGLQSVGQHLCTVGGGPATLPILPTTVTHPVCSSWVQPD